tara:strand:+ start:316 stop:651 length:336 start_codon:yes stop_codon:yes gene_type:complete
MEKLYRYEAKRYSFVIDANYDEYGVTSPRLELKEYQVTGVTPKGFWVSLTFRGSKDKWVSSHSAKRFAHPTKEQAIKAYICRKKAFVRHSQNRLNTANADLMLGLNHTGTN